VTGTVQSTTSVATCPAGTFLIGGGHNITGGGDLVTSYPSKAGVAGTWTATTNGGSIQAFATCQVVG
jgi:hypothetical protein